jgi:uncharacterized protein YodC (DUF2158 family)
MATPEIKIGAVVILKSGSPSMTVTAVEQSTQGESRIDCLLWDEAKAAFIKLENLPVSALSELAN